jgi:uncharacterized membrane protein YdjX (TVP38/TMEM64 family)
MAMSRRVRGSKNDPLGRHGVIWRRAVALALLCLVLATLAGSDDLHDALLEVLEASKRLIVDHPLLGAIIFMVLSAAAAMFAFFSAAIVVPVAVFAWGESTSMALLWAGWIVGGTISYAIARYLGRAVVHWLTADRALRRVERRIRPDTPFRLILLFQLALPSEIPGYVLGLVRYPFGKFLMARAISELPFAVATIYLGAGFVGAQTGLVLAVGLSIVLLCLGALYLLRKYMPG